MDLVEQGTNPNAGQMIKDDLAEKCQKLFQAFLEEWVNACVSYCSSVIMKATQWVTLTVYVWIITIFPMKNYTRVH